MFAAFFARKDTFALGVCNGCQMLSQLGALVDGAERWPRFVQNRSERFEARVALVRIEESPSIFFRGMAGSVLPIAVSHGEGRAEIDTRARSACSSATASSRRASSITRTHRTERFPFNPNGSPGGVDRVHDARRARDDHHAAPRARLPQRAALVAPARVGRSRRHPVDADVQERAKLGRVISLASRRAMRASMLSGPAPKNAM